MDFVSLMSELNRTIEDYRMGAISKESAISDIMRIASRSFYTELDRCERDEFIANADNWIWELER
jgi:hypothetical protein